MEKCYSESDQSAPPGKPGGPQHGPAVRWERLTDFREIIEGVACQGLGGRLNVDQISLQVFLLHFLQLSQQVVLQDKTRREGG